MNIQDKLSKNRYKVSEESHIAVDRQIVDRDLARRLCLACPAGLYQISEDGKQLLFGHLGCLECGTCRLLGLNKQLDAWDYPIADYGVQFRKS